MNVDQNVYGLCFFISVSGAKTASFAALYLRQSKQRANSYTSTPYIHYVPISLTVSSLDLI